MRLSTATLPVLPPAIRRPTYDRASLRTGVVHLGLGAFHRGHQAPIFDDALQAGDPRWGILSVSIRSPQVGRALAKQDGLYTVISRENDAATPRIIGSIRETAVLAQAPDRVIDAIAAADTQIVTLTVTEKGYRLRPGGGTLDLEDPGVRDDLATPAKPTTIPGLLVAALNRRRARGGSGLNVISCDNLASNGEKLREGVLAMAARTDPALRDWIAQRVHFPATMVDRIVPATTSQDIEAFERSSGIVDEALVTTETFHQWVIEDRLTGAMPDFASLGVILTRDVTAWEMAKLRLLNAAHSAMAYHGLVAGHEFVHEVAASAEGVALVRALWDEAETTLCQTPGLDIAAYRQVTFERFENRALRHRLSQIGADGSQKMSQRIIAPLGERLDQGLSSPALMRVLATWLVCLADGPDGHPTVPLSDPRLDALRELLRGNPHDQIAAMIGGSGLFDRAIFKKETVRDAMVREVERLRRDPRAPLDV